MLRRTDIITRINACTLMCVIMIFCGERSSVFAADEATPGSEPVTINFMNNDKVLYTRWEAVADYNTIKRWAQTRHLEVVPDSQPVVDKTAAFVSHYVSKAEIRNLDPNRNYNLYIDFVSYRGGDGGITSRLVVSAEGEHLAEFSFGDTKAAGYYRIAIPRNIIFDGTLELLFEEAATTSGVWGIWDMVLIDGDLPAAMSVAKVKPEIQNKNQNIIEDKNNNKKNKKHREVVNRKQTGPDAKEKKDDIKIIEPAIKDMIEPKKPDIPGQKVPENPGFDESKLKEPKVNESDIRD